MILSWKTELKEEVITKKNTNNCYDRLLKTESWDMILSWKKLLLKTIPIKTIIITMIGYEKLNWMKKESYC
jgi:hypothetical protein